DLVGDDLAAVRPARSRQSIAALDAKLIRVAGELARRRMGRMLQTMQWTGSALRLLDQTRLPTKTEYVDITDEKQMWDAIKRLVVRGAPAIGVAAAFGVYLGVRNYNGPELLPLFD